MEQFPAEQLPAEQPPAFSEDRDGTSARGKGHALLRRMPAVGLGAALGFFLGMGMDKFGLALLPAEPSPGGFLLFLAGLFVLLWLAMLAQIVLHEAGHLVFGLATGYRFCSFTVCGVMLVRTDGQLRLRLLSIAGMGGQCLMAPPAGCAPEEIPFVLYNLGGVLTNLLSAALFGALVLPARGVPALALFFLLLSLLGLVFAALNGIPMRTEMIENDGKNTASLAKSPAARRAAWVQLAINAQMAQGTRLREMPEAWFSLPDEAEWNNYMIVALAVFRANRLLDAHDIAGAAALIDRLFAADTAMAGIHRVLLTCDRIFCALLLKDAETAGSLLTKRQRLLMKKMRQNPGVLRTEYALALLRDKKPPQAPNHGARVVARAPKHPNPPGVGSGRERLGRAAKTSAKNSTAASL